jgi:small subunit ribosomal protein S5
MSPAAGKRISSFVDDEKRRCCCKSTSFEMYAHVTAERTSKKSRSSHARASTSSIGPLEIPQRTPTTSTVMNVFRPARCLLSGSSIPRFRPRVRCRNFHISPNLYQRREPNFPGVKASEEDIDEDEDNGELADPNEPNFKPYTPEELEALEKRYTPGQLKAIEAGEEAIDIEDLEKRGVIRTDLGRLPYFDDLSKLRPVVDRPQEYEGPMDPKIRPMTPDELLEAYNNAYAEAKLEDPPLPPPTTAEEAEAQKRNKFSPLADMKAHDRMPIFMGTNGPIPRYQTPDLRAPGLPRSFLDDDKPKVPVKKTVAEEEADPRDPEGVYNRLIKQTGLTLDQIMDYKVKILVQHRVVNQTRLGKIASVYMLAVAGNGNGRLGIGEAKGQETEETSNNAKIAAIRAMQPIPRYEERTIFGEVEGKVSAAEVKLMCRPPGKSSSKSARYRTLTNIV